MSRSPDVAESTPLSLLMILQHPPAAGLPARLAALAGAMPEAELRIYGHGDPERMGPPMRELAARLPGAWVELATRARPAGIALVEAVGGCAAPWVLWIPEQAQAGEAGLARRLWRDHRDEAFSGVPLQAPCLFAREALLALPRIPGMMALLPELFSFCRGGPPGPGAPGVVARLRRAYVALACKMGPGRTGHRPQA